MPEPLSGRRRSRGNRRGALLLILIVLVSLLAACGDASPAPATGGQGGGFSAGSPAASPAAGATTPRTTPTTPTTAAPSTPGRATQTSTPARGAGGSAPSSTRGTPTAVLPRPAYTNGQLAADYSAVLKAVTPREPSPGLYAVNIALDYQSGAVTTDFLLLSANGKKLYKYGVSGRERAVVEAPGSPEVVTSDASFTPFTILPWQQDGAWGTHLDKAAKTLVDRGWTPADRITRSTALALTGTEASDWQLAFEAGPKRFRFDARRGELTFSKVADPALPAELPPIKAQPWSRSVAGQPPLFARDFRAQPFGPPEVKGGGFGPKGYQLACRSASCSPASAPTIPLPAGKVGKVVVEGEFAALGGPEEAQYGIIVHAGTPHSLLFGIDRRGNYSVSQGGTNGKTTQLAQGSAKRGDGVDTLAAVVADGTARFFINGAEVWQGPVAVETDKGQETTGDIALFTSSADLQVVVQWARVYAATSP